MLERADRLWSDRLLNAVRDYVHAVLDRPIAISNQPASDGIPPFLTQRYLILEASFADRPCLLMIPRPGTDDTPAAIAKHWEHLRQLTGSDVVIFVANALSNHNRHRLISHRVSFIVPGNQLFVPDLAMDLREHFRAPPEESPETMSPAAQLLVIAVLLGHPIAQATPTSLATRYRYSAMSMGRALDELRALHLVEIEPVGRHRIVTSSLDRHALWHRGANLLRSPVRKRRRIPRPPAELGLPLAGESALSALTDLSEPRAETRAVAASEWKTLAGRHGLDRPTDWSEEVIELETWSYDPSLLSDGAIVDPISLWLSLPDTADERVGRSKDMLLKRARL